jgi:hypothetical protein
MFYNSQYEQGVNAAFNLLKTSGAQMGIPLPQFANRLAGTATSRGSINPLDIHISVGFDKEGNLQGQIERGVRKHANVSLREQRAMRGGG